MDFKSFNTVFTKFIDKSFDDAFKHYSNVSVKVALQEGNTRPVVIVLEGGKSSVVRGDDELGLQIKGVAYGDDNLRKLVKKLGKTYARNIMDEKIDSVPVAIIVASEVVMRMEKDLDDVEKAKPLQDGKGNAINGADEAYMITGITCAGSTKAKIYDIIRNESGAISDMVLNKEITDKTNSDDGELDARLLISFYDELKLELERLGIRDKYELTDDKIKEMKDEIEND